MSILDRILLVILAVGALFAAVVVGLTGLGALGQWPDTFVMAMSVNQTAIYTVVIAVVFALVSIRFLFYRWGSQTVDHVILPGDHGHIRISFEAIRQLANRTGKTIRGVDDFDTRVRIGQAGIVLAVRVRALPDVQLARMSEEIQQAVKSYVEETGGVTVERVTISVTELSNQAAKTQRAWVD